MIAATDPTGPKPAAAASVKDAPPSPSTTRAAPSSDAIEPAPPRSPSRRLRAAVISIVAASRLQPTWVERTCKRLPCETGGIALNLAGMATFFDATAALHPSLEPALYARWVAAGTAWVLLLLSLLKLLCVPRAVAKELQQPKSCGSHGALLMALTLSCSEPHEIDTGGAARAAVHVCAGLQSLMALWYLGWCARLRSPPVPFWFPATVGIGMSTVAGSRVGMSLGLQMSFFVLSAGLCIVLWPWITMRLLLSDRVSPAPSVAILAAPVSLVGLAYFACAWGLRFEEWVTTTRGVQGAQGANASWPASLAPPAPPALPAGDSGASEWHVDRSAGATTIFMTSTACAAATVYFCWRRRAILSQFVQPSRGWAHQEWAGFTFPTVATTSVAVLWEVIARGHTPPPPPCRHTGRPRAP